MVMLEFSIDRRHDTPDVRVHIQMQTLHYLYLRWLSSEEPDGVLGRRLYFSTEAFYELNNKARSANEICLSF
jgi:hypothetical protein